jgi:hypothetical protein
VPRALHAEGAHLGECPVVHHEVDIGHAEAGYVEFDQDFVGFWEKEDMLALYCEGKIGSKERRQGREMMGEDKGARQCGKRRTDFGNGNHFDFDPEVWPFIHDDAGFAFFGDVEDGVLRFASGHCGWCGRSESEILNEIDSN